MKFILKPLLFILCLIQSELIGMTFMAFEFNHSDKMVSEPPLILKSKNISHYQKLENQFYHIVTNTNHSGIVNQNGKLIIDTLFHAVSEPDFENWIIWVRKEMDYPPVINREDTFFDNDDYDWSFDNISGGWQLYDLNGKLLSDSFFYQPYEFSSGIAEVYCNGINEFLINNQGEVLTKFNAEKIYFLNRNSCIIYDDSLYGFTDSNFQIVHQPYFENITHFIGNWALVSINDTIGLINHSGTYIKDITNYLYENSISITDFISLDTFVNVYADFLNTNDDINNCIPGFFLLDSIRQVPFKNHIKDQLILFQWRKLFLNGSEMEMELDIDQMSTMMADTFKYLLPTSPALEFNYSDYETEVDFCSSDLLSFYTCSIEASGNTKREEEDRFYNYEFKHYVRKKEYWKQIDISNLFIGNYKALIKKLIIEQLKTDDACTCENLQLCANLNLNHFTLDEEGLNYHIFLCDTGVQIDSFMNVLEIDIPYTDLRSVIPPTSPLFALVRRLEAVKD